MPSPHADRDLWLAESARPSPGDGADGSAAAAELRALRLEMARSRAQAERFLGWPVVVIAVGVFLGTLAALTVYFLAVHFVLRHYPPA